MSTDSANSKRIAKNTIFLYIRQIIVMVVSLYTSRVVLATLGVTDYGIYNVVGGIVTLFTILNFAMGCSTTRFITFELGRKNENGVNIAFSNAVIVHAIIAVIILILGETIGLYLFSQKMNIPEDRMSAAEWVYHLSVFTCIVNILSVPYNALITSHEKMNAYAVISIIETFLKLIIVWMLLLFSYDKLILYAVLMFVIGLFVRILNQLYTTKTFKNVHFIKPTSFKMFKDMLVYAMWSLVGSAAVILADQGQNILLNMYFGPAVNAARGVSMQVKHAVVNLCNNFNQAITPQINKSYAGGDVKYMHKLIFVSSKYTFYLLFIMSLPIILEARTILGIWLVDAPDHSVAFLQLMLVVTILTALGNPLSNAAGANGKIRNFQLIVGGINLLLLPVTWLTFMMQDSPMPEWAFIVQIVFCLIAQIARLFLVRPLIGLSLRSYYNNVIHPCAVTTFLASVFPLIFKVLLPEGIITSITVIFISIISVAISVFCFGMGQEEKNFVKHKIKSIRNDRYKK